MFRTTFAAALATAAVLLFADSGYAQSNAKADAEENGIVIDLRGQTRERSGNAAAALLAKAAAKGQVRVIVGMDDTVEDTDDETKERAQSAKLNASQRDLARRAGVDQSDVTTYDYIPFVAMGVNAAQLQRLLSDPSVIHIQENMPGKAALAQSVPKIGAPTLWNQNIDGQGWAVAVLDTGVDKSHPMFRQKVVSEACFSNKNNAPGAQSSCPNGAAQAIGPGTGVHCKPSNFGQCFHGTHVAGIAAGHKPQLNGVAKDAKIIAIQVFVKLNGNSSTFDGDWIKGLERVYALRSQFNIGAINMSLGRGRFTGVCDTASPAALAVIKKLRAAKIATLVASMNDSFNGDMRLPACISAAIAVGSTTKQDAISSFSNHALQVRHMAPGSDIRSAYPDNKYNAIDGTSMATPHVAGAYALLRDRRPNATVDDIAAALECTGVPVQRAGVIKRRINVAQAQAYLLHPPNATRNFPFTSDAPGWVQDSGLWGLNSGNLVTDTSTGGWKVATAPNCNEGVNIVARIFQLYNSGATGVTGVIFKAQFAHPFVAGYVAAYNKNANTGQPNVVVLLRLDGYNLQTDSGNFKVLCSATRNHTLNQYNLVRVESRGGVHKMFLNGALACSAVDYAYGTGRTGLAMFVQSSPGAGADSFTIDPAEVVLDAPPQDAAPAEDAPVASVPPQSGSIGALLSAAQ